MDNSSCSGAENKIKKYDQAKNIKIKPKNIGGSVSSGNRATQNSCCSGKGISEACETAAKFDIKQSWIIGEMTTSKGCVPQISSQLTFRDILGTWKVRLGINRMKYKINPGLYAVGTPDQSSPVLVTANYKLTFDSLRRELKGLDAWILVLDTKGVNVWCAAGKGTFGTKELVNRIIKVSLSQIVAHKTLILPQLGAPGISAHEVTKQCGFKVVYGPVRAHDIKEFLEKGMKASDEMREVSFNIIDRMVLTPIEFISAFKTAIPVFGIMFLINLIAVNPFGLTDFNAFVGALLVGCVITPIMLPWIPLRAFAAKGWIMGLIWATSVNILNGWPSVPQYGVLKTIAYILILPSVSSYYAMNFTGSSTYTSFSGVIKEMKAAVPAIALLIGLGIMLLLVNSFIHI